MLRFLILCCLLAQLAVVSAQNPRLALNFWQAFRYRDIITGYDRASGEADFSSGTNAAAPLQFEGRLGKESRLALRILNPDFRSAEPIRSAVLVIGKGAKEQSCRFPWTSPNGLMAAYNFTPEHEELFRFMAENAGGDRIRIVFYGEGEKLLNAFDLPQKDSGKVFLALQLYRELAFGEAVRGLWK